MFNKSVLFIVLTIVSSVISAPVYQDVPPSPERRQITKEDVQLLKEKLASLEADLDKLEPVVPVVPKTTDEGDEEDVETDIDEDEVQAPNDVPQAANEDAVIIPDSPVDQEGDTSPEQAAGNEADEDGDVEIDDGEQAYDYDLEDFMPYRNPEEEDIYLRKLIIQALAVLYRKDADRIGRMLVEQYAQLMSEPEDFPDNAQPAPEDLRQNPDEFHILPVNDESGFAERPFTDDEVRDDLQDQLEHDQVLAIMNAKRRLELDNAEEILAADMQAFQDEGLTVEDILNDLANKQQSGDQRPAQAISEQGHYAEREGNIDQAVLGDYWKERPQDTEVSRDPRMDKESTGEFMEGPYDETVDDTVSDEEADELLEELMANLNISPKKNHGEQQA